MLVSTLARSGFQTNPLLLEDIEDDSGSSQASSHAHALAHEKVLAGEARHPKASLKASKSYEKLTFISSCRSKGPKRPRMHGVTLSDHAEKVTWSGYWEERQRKLESQSVDAALYGAVSSRLAQPLGEPAGLKELFQGCCLYFDGRVDLGKGLSSYALSKLVRLHGAKVTPHLTKNLVSHVVCSQLSGAKERHALHDVPRLTVSTS